MPVSDPQLRTPLYERHVEAGARMVPFAGFELPVLYTSIFEEHRAVRRSAGLFDVSHMGQVRLRGSGTLELAQRLFSNDVAGTRIGKARYGLLCREDGGVIDDLVLYRVDEQEVLFCVNAANRAADLAWMQQVKRDENFKCDLIDESEATALIALQGPRALEIAARLEAADARPPGRWAFRTAELAGVPVWLSRTGYTGEDGYELYAPAGSALKLWDALLEAGSETLRPAGLGARDTLRTEMGYSLYGHELDLHHDPRQAGLERFLSLDHDFIGAAALRGRTPEVRLVGLLLDGRQVARTGFEIFADDAPVGVVTSGTFAPSIERSIAIGYVGAQSSEPGQRLAVEIRRRRIGAVVCTMPFFDRKATPGDGEA
jgi:aminomethyltransferase